MQQDLSGMNMETEYDWAQQQAQDEQLQRAELIVYFGILERFIKSVELVHEVELTSIKESLDYLKHYCGVK